MSNHDTVPQIGKLTPTVLLTVSVAVLYGLFHLYFSTLGTISESWRNAIHVGGAMFFIYMFAANQQTDRFSRAFLYVLAALSILAPVYFVVMEERLYDRGDQMIWSDLWVAAVVFFLVVYAAKRASGWLLPVMAMFLAAYTLWLGPYFPGDFSFRGLSYYTFAYRIHWAGEGYYGFLPTVSATFVYLFILFGTVLLASGGGAFLVQVAVALGSRLPGGPAQAAVFGSAMMGSVTGTSIGNVMATGSVTIPMMIRSGYKREFAAGVEASASNVGQVMPPIMGAGAFILAAWTQTPYTTIAMLSILPALLYIYSVFIGVAVYSRKANFNITVEKQRVEWLNGIPFLTGIGTLILMLVLGWTAIYACCTAILTTVIASWFTPQHKILPRTMPAIFYDAAANASVTAIMLSVANVIVAMLMLTGKAVVLSSGLVDLAQGEIYFLILAVIIVSLILGMGLPITASYVIVATVVGSGFSELGYTVLAVHLMIYWYSQDSTVTPPIALSAFAAAGIAGARPFPSSIVAWKLSKGLYVIPVLFLSGDILFENGAWAAAIAFVGAVIGLTGLAIAIARHGLMGKVPAYVAAPLFISSVGCFIIERDIALYAMGVSVVLIVLAEFVSRRTLQRDSQSKAAVAE